MAGMVKDNAPQDDEDEFNSADFINEEDEKIKADILAKFNDAGDDSDSDENWLSPEIDETPLDHTPQSDGQKVIERAENASRKARKTEDATEDGDDTTDDDNKSAARPDSDAAPKNDADTKGAKGEADDDTSADLASAALDALLDGIPDDRRSEISRRVKESDAMLAPFRTPYVQGQMKKHGTDAPTVASRLVELASFAEEKPDEYLAWAAQEMAASPDKAGEVLAAAAKLHGFKLVRDSDEDDDEDMFLDDKTRAILEENKRLKAAGGENAPGFGPDTPQRQQARAVAQALEAFTSETDETGNLKRPMFEPLRPRISQMANAHKLSTGQAVTLDDLGRFYEAAVAEVRTGLGAPSQAQPSPSAAQAGGNVSDVMKKKAAAAEKARRASKSIGGAGQGAHRQPAQSGDDEKTLDVVKRLAAELGFNS